MKVNIGPYKSYMNIYTIVYKLRYIGLPEDTLQNLGDYLNEAKWITWLIDKYNSTIAKRRIKVRIDEYDTWGMYDNLAMIIAPMLRQLKVENPGYAFVDDEDVPEHMRTGDKEYGDSDEALFIAKWDYVMDEMIYAFTQIENNARYDIDWESKFYSGEVDWITKETQYMGEKFSTLETGPNHTFKVDREGFTKECDRITNGFRLFGRYYWSLWE